MALCQATEVPADFLNEAQRAQGAALRDPFEVWSDPHPARFEYRQHCDSGDLRGICDRLVAQPVESFAISAVTQGELMYGLAKRKHPTALSALVHEFLICMDVLPWTGEAANGVRLGALDMMIAAHAVAAEAVLISRIKAFQHVGHGLRLESWGNLPRPFRIDFR